jgi:O-antigen ligase
MMFESIAKRSLLIFAVSCTLLATLQQLGFISSEVGKERLTTSFGDNPNVVASVLSLGLLALVGAAYGRNDANIKLRLLAWLCSGFLLMVVVRTGARGSQLALVLALITLIVRRASISQKVKTTFIVLAVIVSLGWAVYQIDAVRERWERTFYEGEIASRDRLMPVAWEMFLERPITGWGPINHYWEMNIRTGDPDGGDPHNLYLWLLNETGLLGSIPFLMGLWFCWCSAWKARGSDQASLPLAWLVFVLAINTSGTYLYYKLVWFALAYAVASGSYAVVRSDAYWPPVGFRKTPAPASVS